MKVTLYRGLVVACNLSVLPLLLGAIWGPGSWWKWLLSAGLLFVAAAGVSAHADKLVEAAEVEKLERMLES